MNSELPRGVSVVVCCYNSSARLPETLRCLAAQQMPADLPWEILIIDNASTDDTAAKAPELWAALGCTAPLRVISEPTAGQAYARRRGVLNARYSYTTFCDDDNWLVPDYLARAAAILDDRPEVGAVGGASTPVSDKPFPPHFFTHAESFAIGVQGAANGDISRRGYLWGAGMFLRTACLQRIFESGIEGVLGGRAGGKTGSGDDGEICEWYLIAGFRLWYDDRLVFQHLLPSGRMTRDYLSAIHAGFEEAAPTLLLYRLMRRGWVPENRLLRNMQRAAMAAIGPLVPGRRGRLIQRVAASMAEYGDAIAKIRADIRALAVGRG